MQLTTGFEVLPLNRLAIVHGKHDMENAQISRLHRRDFIQAAAAGAALVGAGSTTARADQPSETNSAISAQPAPAFGNDQTTADILVETLIAWGATHAFGIVGDGINSIIEALRKRQDKIRYIGVRHEEAAAFMASGFAKHAGRLGVCLGTTGPAPFICSMGSMTPPSMARRWSP
jgi:pyruvate dehydrogenase (quinone)